MNALIVFSHPNPASFNAAILEQVTATLTTGGATVVVRDLYAQHFNPVFTGAELGGLVTGQGSFADVVEEQRHLAWADLVVFIYPIWWLDRPAVLKGYIDRVFVNGFAFDYTAAGPVPLLKGKKAFVVQTAGSPIEQYQQWGLVGAAADTMGKGTLAFVGFTEHVETLYAVNVVDDAARHQMLATVAERLTQFTAAEAAVA